MKAEHHLAVAVPVSVGVWFFTGNIWYVLMSLFLGFFIDIDHIIDYVREERKFDFKHLFIKSYDGDFKHLWIIFHAYEYIIIAWIVGYFTGHIDFAVVFTIAYLSHMIPDQYMNNVHPFGYFMIFRIAVKFDMWKIFHYDRRKTPAHMVEAYEGEEKRKKSTGGQ